MDVGSFPFKGMVRGVHELLRGQSALERKNETTKRDHQIICEAEISGLCETNRNGFDMGEGFEKESIGVEGIQGRFLSCRFADDSCHEPEYSR